MLMLIGHDHARLETMIQRNNLLALIVLDPMSYAEELEFRQTTFQFQGSDTRTEMQTYQYPEGGNRPDEGQRNNLLVTSGTICWCTSGRWVTTICLRRVTRISLISAGKCVRNCAHVPQIFYGVHNGGCKHTPLPQHALVGRWHQCLATRCLISLLQ